MMRQVASTPPFRVYKPSDSTVSVSAEAVSGASKALSFSQRAHSARPNSSTRVLPSARILTSSPRADLPAWPLLALLYGFPLLWALGVLQIAPPILALIMVAYMTVRGGIRVPGTLWIWGALTLWVLVCAMALRSSTDLIAWGLRWVNIASAGVYALYFYNAPQTLTLRRLLGGLATLWGTLVVLGWAGVLFPEFRLQTPMSFVVPSGLMRNPLVRDYMQPPLAEIQFPWGAPEPYKRPSAPFPYANSWGLAYTLLTPVMLAIFTLTRRIAHKILLLIALGLSTVPAISTSNRGMFIGLGVCCAYVLFRQVLAARWRAVAWGLAAIVAAVIALFASGTVDAVLGRQDYSDSTGGRATLYQLTWEATLQSPILGYGTPRMAPSVGVSMGTQGYLWTLMFCFGFVGLGFFVLWVLGSIVSGWSAYRSFGDHPVVAWWLHSVSVCAAVVFIFYSFDIAQLSILLLTSTACVRAVHASEVKEGRHVFG